MIDGLRNGQDFEGPLNQRSLPGLFSSSVSTGLNSNCPSRSEHWCDQNLRKNPPARALRAGKDREGWNSPPFSFSLVCPPSSPPGRPYQLKRWPGQQQQQQGPQVLTEPEKGTFSPAGELLSQESRTSSSCCWFLLGLQLLGPGGRCWHGKYRFRR